MLTRDQLPDISTTPLEIVSDDLSPAPAAKPERPALEPVEPPKAAPRPAAAKATEGDPIHYVGHVAPAALLLQFARFDVFIDERQALQYAAAGSQPKQVRWYDTGHDLFSADAVADRLEWLGLRLRLQPVRPIVDRRLGMKRGG